MAGKKIRCSQCGEYRQAGKHRCRVKQGPPPAAAPGVLSPSASAPRSPVSEPASPASPLNDDGTLGEMFVLAVDYDSKRDAAADESRDPSERMSAILELETAAEKLASSPDGYQRVLADAAQLLKDGQVERAALLSRAAARAADSSTSSDEPKLPNVPKSTRPERLNALRAAEKESQRLDQERRDLALRAGGAFRETYCSGCNHAHPQQRCICGCSSYAAATADQVAAYHANETYQEAERERQQLAIAAQQLRVGDRGVVKGGKSAPEGFRGYVVRTHQGEWGPRLLLKSLEPHSTEEYWVSTKHVQHLT